MSTSATTYTPQLPAANHPTPRGPTFRTHRDVPTLPVKTKLLCEIVATTAPFSTAAALTSAGVSVTHADVENVINLSYSFLTSAIEFFRWAGCQPGHSHSPLSWNLVVDLLGKNLLFDQMWDFIGSMKRRRLTSLATFASVFGSYVVAGRVRDALTAFEVMHNYDVKVNVAALNSLVSAICRDGNSVDASEYVRAVKHLNVIRPDADTYAILLEGWEKEKDVVNARQTFAEMVVEIGWGYANTFAYEACLCTLLLGRDGLSEAMEVLGMMADRGRHPGMKFFGLASEECYKRGDLRGMESLCEAMARANLRPDVGIYCKKVALYCYKGSIEQAMKVFNELVSSGGFPDSRTCNVLFTTLVNGKKLNEAAALLSDMVKKGWVPDQDSCVDAVLPLSGEAVRMSVDSKGTSKAEDKNRKLSLPVTKQMKRRLNVLKMKCFSRQQKGHIGKDCPRKPDDMKGQVRDQTSSGGAVRLSADSNSASKAEDKRRKLNLPVTTKKKRSVDVSKIKCFNCQQKGHIGKNCPSNPDEVKGWIRDQAGSVRDQTNCVEAVRLFADSKDTFKAGDRKKKLNLPGTKKTKKRSMNVSKIKYFTCNQKGHLGKDCPKKPNEMKERK